MYGKSQSKEYLWHCNKVAWRVVTACSDHISHEKQDMLPKQHTSLKLHKVGVVANEVAHLPACQHKLARCNLCLTRRQTLKDPQSCLPNRLARRQIKQGSRVLVLVLAQQVLAGSAAASASASAASASAVLCQLWQCKHNSQPGP